MALRDEAREAILQEIIKEVSNANAAGLRDLAEAFAWVTNPGQPHGGAAASSK